jgi:hypothetical protein
MIINETHKDFAKYYLQSLDIEHFKTAELTDKIPDMGNIYIVDEEVIALVVVYNVDRSESTTWWLCVWACKRKNSNKLMFMAKELMNRVPKNSILLSHIQTKHVYNHAVYRASLYLVKLIGFKLVNSNEYCDIVEYRK